MSPDLHSDHSNVAAIEAALEVVERLMYGWDNEKGRFGLWDPETRSFVIHVPKDAMNLRPYRAQIIAARMASVETDETGLGPKEDQ